MITSQSARATIDCRIREPQQDLAALAIDTSAARTQVVETTSLKFEAIGDDCEGRDSFVISAYARKSDGTRLNAPYAFASLDYDSLI